MFEFTPSEYSVQLSRFENDFALYGSLKRENTDSGAKNHVEQHPPVIFEPSPNSNLKVTSNKITVTVVP